MNKKISLLLLTAFMGGTSLMSQDWLEPSYPLIETLPASNVESYGFKANWKFAEWVAGYRCRVYYTMTAQEDGQEFTLVNTDFSYITEGTVENPKPLDLLSYGLFQEIGRYGWAQRSAVHAEGMLGIRNHRKDPNNENDFGLNGHLCSPISPAADFSNGGGEVHVSFSAMGIDARKLRVELYRFGDTLDFKNIYLTKDMQKYDITLKNGRDSTVLLFSMDSKDNGVIFFDDMKITQKLKKGEVGVIQYTQRDVTDYNITSCEISTDELTEPGESYAYGIAGYFYGLVGRTSDLVFVGNKVGLSETPIENGLVTVEGNTLRIRKTDASDAVEVYDTAGKRVFTDRSGDMDVQTALPHAGIYLVRIGQTTHKVAI